MFLTQVGLFPITSTCFGIVWFCFSTNFLRIVDFVLWPTFHSVLKGTDSFFILDSKQLGFHVDPVMGVRHDLPVEFKILPAQF